jgi:hypothetical protein
VIAWGVAGLYLSDKAEEHFGLTPTEKDKEDLEKLKPQLHMVDRKQDR